jgi:hypothetical protein
VRKRKTNYPPAKTAKKPARPTGLPTDAPQVRSTVATIDTGAGRDTSGLIVGRRVRIAGTGPFAGETATIQKLISGVIAQAIVATDAGASRRVRTADLEALSGQGSTPPAGGSAAEGSATA